MSRTLRRVARILGIGIEDAATIGKKDSHGITSRALTTKIDDIESPCAKDIAVEKKVT